MEPAPEIVLQRAGQRFVTAGEGIRSRHAFSFGEHYDPSNIAFGSLLVHNDEIVQSGHGYGDHPHADAEIVTWVLSGSLVHEDSVGHRRLVYPGLAQRMSAGRGVVHAERNDAYRVDSRRPVVPVHFVQMWVRPDELGVPPSYAQREFDVRDLDGGWLPIASGQHPDAVVSLGARGSTLWATVLAPGARRLLPPAPRTHLYLARGTAEVEGVGPVGTGDAVRISGGAQLAVTGRTDAELLAWTMPG